MPAKFKIIQFKSLHMMSFFVERKEDSITNSITLHELLMIYFVHKYTLMKKTRC